MIVRFILTLSTCPEFGRRYPQLIEMGRGVSHDEQGKFISPKSSIVPYQACG
jgi:hypothetical protein